MSDLAFNKKPFKHAKQGRKTRNPDYKWPVKKDVVANKELMRAAWV